jgi:hypothetical protein
MIMIMMIMMMMIMMTMMIMIMNGQVTRWYTSAVRSAWFWAWHSYAKAVYFGAISIEMRSLYQDRLEPNIGKPQNNTVFYQVAFACSGLLRDEQAPKSSAHNSGATTSGARTAVSETGADLCRGGRVGRLRGALYLTLGGWALHYLPFAFVPAPANISVKTAETLAIRVS